MTILDDSLAAALLALFALTFSVYVLYSCSVFLWFAQFVKYHGDPFSPPPLRKRRLLSDQFTFCDYMYYSFTLSFFYLLSILLSYLWTSVRIWLWDNGHRDHFGVGENIDDGETIERGIFYLLLDSSMAMTVKEVTRTDSGEVMALFDLGGFHCPHRDKATGKHALRHIQGFQVRLELSQRKFHDAIITLAADDTVLNLTPAETLVLLYQAISAYVHTAIHVAANAAFDHADDDQHETPGFLTSLTTLLLPAWTRPAGTKPAWFSRAAAYTRGINLAATGASFATYCMPEMSRDDFARQLVADANAVERLFFPNHARAYVQLAPYSDYLSFLLSARVVILSEIAQCPEAASCIPDAEAYFVAVAVHAIDHISAERIDPLTLYTANLKSTGAVDTFSSMWTRALFGQFDYVYSFLLPTTRMRDSPVPWHQRAYARMTKINPELAYHVDTCVSW